MTLIWLINADKKRFFSVNQLNLRHLRAILLYMVALMPRFGFDAHWRGARMRSASIGRLGRRGCSPYVPQTGKGL